MCDVVTKFGPWAIVAGASEGLGAAFAHLLASHGLNLILIARREAPLASLAAALEKTYGISVAALPMDLSTEAAVQRLDDATATRDVGLLVYNAAFSTKGDFCETPIDQLEMIVSLNCSIGVSQMLQAARASPREEASRRAAADELHVGISRARGGSHLRRLEGFHNVACGGSVV